MQSTVEWNVSLPIGPNNTARFTGTRLTSALKHVSQGGGTRWTEWQHMDTRQQESLKEYRITERHLISAQVHCKKSCSGSEEIIADMLLFICINVCVFIVALTLK